MLQVNVGDGGREQSYTTVAQFNSNLLVDKACTGMLELQPGMSLRSSWAKSRSDWCALLAAHPYLLLPTWLSEEWERHFLGRQLSKAWLCFAFSGT